MGKISNEKLAFLSRTTSAWSAKHIAASGVHFDEWRWCVQRSTNKFHQTSSTACIPHASEKMQVATFSSYQFGQQRLSNAITGK